MIIYQLEVKDMKKTELNTRIKRIRIYGILGILYSFYLIYDYFFNKKLTWVLIIAICLFIISILFILSTIWLKKRKK